MLKTFEKLMDGVYYGNSKHLQTGNFTVEMYQDGTIGVRHYGNRVAIVNTLNETIEKSKTFWNYSMSTTRLCNDIKRYFNGYKVI